MEYHLGFTGTRLGMTPEQRHSVRTIMGRFKTERSSMPVEHVHWFHHGDCVGSDAEAHEIAYALGYKIHVHPPIKELHRAFCKNYDRIAEPRTYRQRNTDIVRASVFLLAAVRSEELGRGGTWMTVGIARDLDTVPILVYPSGMVDNTDWEKVMRHA